MPRTDALLLIRLHAQNSLVWWLRDASGHVTTGVELGELGHINAATQVVLIVPGNEVLLTHVDLPDLPAARLVKAIPFALEDQVASSIDTLHFSLGTRRRGEPLPVAVVERALLDSWITRLGEAGLIADVIMPDCLCIPFTSGRWSVVLEGEFALVRLDAMYGYTIESSELAWSLRTNIEALGDAVPEVITVTRIAAAQGNLPVLADIGVALAEGEAVESFMAMAASVISQAVPMNLLQGEYQPIHRTVRLRRQWRWAKNIAIAWIAVFVLSHIGQLVYLKIASSRLTKQINAQYQRDFPQASAVVEPRVRIGRELQSLTAAAQGSDFLRVLTLAGNEVHQVKAIKLISLTFQNERLTLNLTAPNFTVLNNLEQKMREQGLVVNQQSATTKGKIIEAQLNITEPK